jgi:hypothetical protein
VISFETPNGASYTVASPNSCNPPCDEVGDQLPVRYNPLNPEQATLDNGIGIWAMTACFGAGALFALVIGMVIAVRGYRSGNYWAVAEGLTELVD